MREISTATEHLYGRPLPDDDCGRDILRLLLEHAAHAPKLSIRGVAAAWAPWLSANEREHFEREAATAPPPSYSPDALAHRLGLKYEVRTCLGITTIGAIDADREMRQRLARERRAQKAREKRRAARDQAALTAHRNEAFGLRLDLPERQGAIKTALIGEAWIKVADLANTVGKWPAFRGLAGGTLRRTINRELDRLESAGIVLSRNLPGEREFLRHRVVMLAPPREDNRA